MLYWSSYLLSFRRRWLGSAFALVMLWGSVSLAANGTESETEPTDQPRPQCGHWAILRSCELLGVPIKMERVMDLMPYTEGGHNLKTLVTVLEEIGLHCRGRQETFDALTGEAFPVIAHMQPDHFVVVFSAGSDHVTLFDGSGRRRVWATKEFRERWTKKALFVWREPDDGPLPRATGPLSGSWPRIQFSTLMIDVGGVSSVGEPITFVFPFQNKGTADLVIDRPQTDCKCIDSLYPTEPIAPETQSQIVLKYTVGEGRGPFTHHAYVKTNDPVVPVIRLTASGNTNTTVTAEPRYLDFGTILEGESRTRLCHVTNFGDMPLSIAGVESVIEGVSISHRILTKKPKNSQSSQSAKEQPASPKNFLLEITATPDGRIRGRTEGALYIRTNIEEFERIRIPVVATITPPIIALPRILFLGEVKPGDSVRKTIRVLSLDGNQFRIIDIDMADTGLDCRYPEEETEEAVILFSGRVQDPRKTMQEKILVQVAPSEEDRITAIELPVSGFFFNE